MSEDQLIKALRNLVAIERDRQLGYRPGDFHMDSKEALLQAEEALQAAGVSTDELLDERDRRNIGLE